MWETIRKNKSKILKEIVNIAYDLATKNKTTNKGGRTVVGVISLLRISEFYYADETGVYLNGMGIPIVEFIREDKFSTLWDTNFTCIFNTK